MGVPKERKRKLKGVDTVKANLELLKGTKEGLVQLAKLRGGISQGAVIDELVEGALKKAAQHLGHIRAA